MSNDHILYVGIATLAESKKRTIDIASGRRRSADEPRVWFTSLESWPRSCRKRKCCYWK